MTKEEANELDRELSSILLGMLPPWVGYQDKHDNVLQQYYKEVFTKECEERGDIYIPSYPTWADDQDWDFIKKLITEKTGESYEYYVQNLNEIRM